MSRMPSPIEQLKARIGFTPAVLRQRCGVCVHHQSVSGPAGFYNISCEKHGLMTTGFSLCKDFAQRLGTAAVKDPC